MLKKACIYAPKLAKYALKYALKSLKKICSFTHQISKIMHVKNIYLKKS